MPKEHDNHDDDLKRSMREFDEMLKGWEAYEQAWREDMTCIEDIMDTIEEILEAVEKGYITEEEGRAKLAALPQPSAVRDGKPHPTASLPSLPPLELAQKLGDDLDREADEIGHLSGKLLKLLKTAAPEVKDNLRLRELHQYLAGLYASLPLSQDDDQEQN